MREMKDSGQAWIGHIPTNWDVGRIDSFYSLRNTKVSDKDYPPLSVTMNGVVPQLDTAAKTNAHDDRKLVKKGDFAINSRSDRRGSCGISPCDGSVSLINTILAPKGEMDPEYYNWLFHTVQFADEFYRWGHGIVDDLWTTNYQDMKKINIPVPPISEQREISSLLNYKCTEIDALIADIQSQIDTLEQYKRSVITEAVTKGLNSDAEMKDSGIEWIGYIAEECIVVRLKYDTYMKGRIGWQGLKSQDFIDEGPFCVTSTDFQDGKVVWERCYHVSEERYEMDPYIQIKEGDLLISKDGTIGKLALIDKLPDKACLNSHLLIIRPSKRYSTKYLFYVLSSDIFVHYYSLVGSGSTMQSLPQEKLGEFSFPIWSIPKQEKIVAFLDSNCAEIDAIISKKREQLSIVAEYKKSLIYEYVTGKKEVQSDFSS